MMHPGVTPPFMSLPVLGRAQLLQVLDQLPPEQWTAAAAALGFVRRAVPQVIRVRGDLTESSGGLAAVVGMPQAAPTDRADLPFWRIAAEHPVDPVDWPTTAPSWLTEAPVIWKRLPEGDPDQTVPSLAELAPPPRQARFLRQSLATPSMGGALDLDRLCRQLAECRVASRLPRLARPVWPGRVQLLVDLAAPLTPFHADFWSWTRQLRLILGRRCRCLLARGGHPAELEHADTALPARLWIDDPGPILILSDAGLYAPDSQRRQRWRELGERCARRGRRPLLLAPCPHGVLDEESASRFQCVMLERGAPLRQGVRRHAARQSASDHAESRPVDALLAALALGARTEPPLLRELRLTLAGLGSDIGWEYAVWNHPGVVSDELACALRPEHREAAGETLAALPAEVRSTLWAVRESGHRHLSPLVRMEESFIAARLADKDAGPARAEARSYAATLFQDDGDRGLRQPLTAFIAGLGRRHPELLSLSPELTLAWGLAHRERLRGATQPSLPQGLGLESLAWLLDEAHPARAVMLGQVGGSLGVYPRPAGPAGPCCALAELESDRDYWQLDSLSEVVGRTTEPRVLHLGQSLSLDPTSRYRLTIGRHQLDLESVRRPSWAEGLGRDVTGLFAELPNGRRLYWMARQRLLVGEGADTGLDLPHGAWWDADDYRAWLDAGRRLARPDWAVRDGIDQSGWWAEIAPKGVIQRMRWIPPGEFLMGSPVDEPERTATDDWAETQHPVVLSRGFWLADTACTQTLWAAVLGESPSHFKGSERPVEQMSWSEVVERFLPALNVLVPGLDARLPTEAQWEYACRAGTTTAFSFGPNISTDQVNYDGNYPYAGGPKGEHREQTVEVKSLPANDWGLYQMHGNVWEWCADWLGDYPAEAVVDPMGPTEGRGRVLRGGGWIDFGGFCRSADRDARVPGYRVDFIGFRLSRGSSPRPAGSAGAAGVAAGGGAPAASPATPTRGRRQEIKKPK